MQGIEDLHPTYQEFMRERYLTASPNHQKQMISLLRRMPPPEKLSKKWVLEFLGRPSARGQKLSNDSIVQYLAKIQQVAKWLERMDILEGIGRPRKRRLSRDDILEMSEVRHLLQNAPDSRGRALIHLLAETGLRIDEALSIQIENIVADGSKQRIIDALGERERIMGRMWKIQISRSKTIKRTVYVYDSTPSVLAWLIDHPVKKGPLFVGKRKRVNGLLVYEELTYSGAYDLITRTYINAGYQDEHEIKRLRLGIKLHPESKELEKRLTFEFAKPPIPKRRIHVFRHAAGTQMVKDRMHPEMMNRAMGWTPGSSAPSVYIHLVTEDLEEEMRRRYGLSEESPRRDPGIESSTCPVCGNMNPPTTGICINCPPRPTPVDEELKRLQEEVEELKTRRSEDLGRYAKELIKRMKEEGVL